VIAGILEPMELSVPKQLGRRLAQARVEAGLSQAALAEHLCVSTRMITYYEAGTKMPTADRLLQVARALGKSVSWLFADSEAESGEALPVPLYDEVPAGPAREAGQAALGTVHVPARWLRGRGEVYCLRVRGRSMEPLLMEGDVIAVRRQPDAENGQVVVVGLPGEADAGDFTVKRLARRGDRLVLKAENPSYPALAPEGPVRIEGIVVGVIRDL